jgi:hypothetical protein
MLFQARARGRSKLSWLIDFLKDVTKDPPTSLHNITFSPRSVCMQYAILQNLQSIPARHQILSITISYRNNMALPRPLVLAFFWIIISLAESPAHAFQVTSLRKTCSLLRNSRSKNKRYSFPIQSNLDVLVGGATAFTPQASTYYLTRIVLLRALAFVYAVAFLIAYEQNKALVGDLGITPARHVLKDAEERGKLKLQARLEWLGKPYAGKTKTINNPFEVIGNTKVTQSIGMALNRNSRFQYWRERLWDRADSMGRPVTSLLWLANDRNKLNGWFDGIATCGISLSLIAFVLGAANLPLMLGLWVCQRSLMAVGGPWYGFGWEPQLAELGFHALFLVPLLSLDPFAAPAPSPIVMFAIRWYLFRVMMGAGLIKLRSGDPKWKLANLSAMNFFYETQPVPNPVTRYLHWMPKAWHKFEVLSNHFVELIAPFLLLAPFAPWRRMGAIIQMSFQAILISSGNLSFLNWLTIVPAIACLDDLALSGLFPSSVRNMAAFVAYKNLQPSAMRRLVNMVCALLIGTLSIPVVKNLLSKRQLMNASFDPLRLVNSYGAFGTVDEERQEFIVSAASDIDGPWKEYEFKVKPGDVMRRPRFLSPFHYRLDWQMWIASTCQNIDRSPWLYNFLLKLLESDPGVLKLLERDPFEGDEEKPKYIRIDKYRYKFHKPSGKSKELQPYWEREMIGRVFPRQGLATEISLKEYIREG